MKEIVEWISEFHWWEVLGLWFLFSLVVNNAWEFLMPESHAARVYRRTLNDLQTRRQRAVQDLRTFKESKPVRPEGTPALRNER